MITDSNFSNQNIAVVGIVKDAAKSFHDDYSRLKNSLSGFKTTKWFVVESNSSDSTIDELSKIRSKDSNFDFTSLGKNQEIGESRTIAMAHARNRYLVEIRENTNYQNVDLVVVVDFNGLNNLISEDSIISCFRRNDWDVCFANQTKKYYDIWALRHSLWSPNDCWNQHAFFRKYSKFPELALYSSVQSRMIHIPSSEEWIEVDSAFGGFAIYRRKAISDGLYSGLTDAGLAICEHVPFNLHLRSKGFRLFINPALINADSTDHSENAHLGQLLKRIVFYPLKAIRSK